MDWPNERYVRFYTRRTADDLALCWQARLLWPNLLAIADRAGLIAIRQGERRLKLLAGLVGAPLDFVQLAMPDLLEDGRIREIATGYVIPNYLEAQEAHSSDGQRQRKRRERLRDQAMGGVTKRDDVSRNVTATVTPSQNVTSGHENGQKVTPSLAVPYLAVPSPQPPIAQKPVTAPPAPGLDGDELEEESPPLTIFEALEFWQARREVYELPRESVPKRTRTLFVDLLPKHSRDQWLGAIENYLDTNLSIGATFARNEWPLAQLLTEGVLRKKMPLRPARAVLCATCGEVASTNGAGQPIRTAVGKATCYSCIAAPTSGGGAA